MCIFTERFTWLKPYSRRTERLTNILQKLAFSKYSLNAEKVAHVLQISISHDTLLAIIRETSIERKVQKGTLRWHNYMRLYLSSSIEFLPDRVMETVYNWLKLFPYIQIVSRDGSLTNKDAFTQANPKIEQILDRWHVLKNAKDALLEWLKTVIPATIKRFQLIDSTKLTEIQTELE